MVMGFNSLKCLKSLKSLKSLSPGIWDLKFKLRIFTLSEVFNVVIFSFIEFNTVQGSSHCCDGLIEFVPDSDCKIFGRG